MADLVKRQDVKKNITEYLSDCYRCSRRKDKTILEAMSIDIEAVIASLPSAQPDIVYCKECINHKASGLCEGWSRYGTITTRDDGFCAWGARLEDGESQS